ncbi:hypothetical protein [Micromonospora chersina]|uniref:hypothetical protein n=1 Tax=Micromonospora chersina TaxID=47854 RepID=UPI0033A6622E
METGEQAQVLEQELRQMEQVHVLQTALRQTVRIPTSADWTARSRWSELAQRLAIALSASLAERLTAKLNEMGYEIRKMPTEKKATTAAKRAPGSGRRRPRGDQLAD